MLIVAIAADRGGTASVVADALYVLYSAKWEV